MDGSRGARIVGGWQGGWVGNKDGRGSVDGIGEEHWEGGWRTRMVGGGREGGRGAWMV